MRCLILGIVCVFLLSACEKLEKSNAPQIFKTPEVTGKSIVIQGIGYPQATVGIYINDQLAYGTTVAKDGHFKEQIEFQKDGQYTIKANQNYKNVKTDFSPPQVVTADLIPPKPEIEIDPSFPLFTNQAIWQLQGSAEPRSNINGLDTVTDESGHFKKEVTLREGLNQIPISLSDSMGNKTETLKTLKVTLDTTPPQFNGNCWNPFASPVNSRSITQEYVCISYGRFHSYSSTYHIPITGGVRGQIKTLRIAGKPLKWNEDGQINQVVPIQMRFGTNNLNVEIVDMVGNRTTAIYPIEIVSDSDRENENLEDLSDRIDDLDSKIDDLKE